MPRIFGGTLLQDFIMSVFWCCWMANLQMEGLSVPQAAISLALFFFAVSVFEVPTGYIADRFGRKLSTISGLLLMTVSFTAVVISRSTTFVVPALAVAGIGYTLISGARTAWYLTLARKINPNFSSERYFLDLEIFGRVATIIGGFLGVYLTKADPTYFWILLSISGALATLLAFCTPNDSSKLTREGASIRGLMSNRSENFPLALLVLFGSSLFIGTETGFRSVVFQPYIVEFNAGDVVSLGYFQCTLALARLSGVLIYRFKLIRLSLGVPLAFLSLVFFGLAEIFASFAPSYLSFIVFYAPSILFMAWYHPIRMNYLNELIVDRYRATLLSLDSLIINLTSGLACFVFAVFPSLGLEYKYAWAVGGIFSIAGALAFLASHRINRMKSYVPEAPSPEPHKAHTLSTTGSRHPHNAPFSK